MMAAPDTGSFPQAHAAFALARQGAPAWMTAARSAGLARFLTHGLPNRKHEEWKYTSLRNVAEAAFVPAPLTGVAVEALVAAALEKLAARPSVILSEAKDLPAPGTAVAADETILVYVDGTLSTAHSRLSSLPRGATIRPLSEADATLQADLAAEPTHWADHPFVALSQAFLDSGTVIEVSKGVALQNPIHIVYVATTPRAAVFPRTVVKLGELAEAKLVETFVGLLGAVDSEDGTARRADSDDASGRRAEGPSHLVTSRVDLILAQGAQLDYTKTQIEGPGSFHIGLAYARLARDARLQTMSHAQGGRLIRNDLAFDLDGEGAALVMDGLYLGQGREHIDNHTVVDHKVPHATSDQLYKGVLRDAARAVFNGKVIVRQDAQKTAANQMNRNLLLSSEAEIDTKPELLIDADDVKCSHGAAVGQLRPDEIFYLQSRGLDRDRAVGILSAAFADEVLLKLPAVATQNRLRRLTKEWFAR